VGLLIGIPWGADDEVGIDGVEGGVEGGATRLAPQLGQTAIPSLTWEPHFGQNGKYLH
jgi:hypothetical protein